MAIGLIVLGYYFFVYASVQKKLVNNLNNATTPASAVKTVQPVSSGTNLVSNIILTAVAVAQHKTSADCWLIVSNKIYNVSSYPLAHPGGAQAILNYCGADATAAFLTKGGQGSHSGLARQSLASMYLGNLNGNASAQKIKATAKQNFTTARSAVGRGDREYYDD